MNALTIQMFVLRIHTATTLKAATPAHVMWGKKTSIGDCQGKLLLRYGKGSNMLSRLQNPIYK